MPVTVVYSSDPAGWVEENVIAIWKEDGKWHYECEGGREGGFTTAAEAETAGHCCWTNWDQYMYDVLSKARSDWDMV